MSRADLESLRVYLENLKQRYIQPLERELERIESIAKGAQGATSFDDYSSMISELNFKNKESMNVGANILIVTLNVPDLWVSDVLEESIPYLYVSDDVFVQELSIDGKIQVGHFVLSPLETLKVNLENYPTFEDYPDAKQNTAGVIKIGNYYGFTIGQAGSAGVLIPLWASNNEIESKNGNRFINAKNVERATMSSLADCTDATLWTDDTAVDGEPVKGTKTKARELLGAIGKTDKAGAGVLGLISASNSYCTQVNTTGNLMCRALLLEEYKKGTTAAFVSKGTLENISFDYVMRALTEYKVQEGETSIWTEDVKAKACETIGALKAQTNKSVMPMVYIKNADGTQGSLLLVDEWDKASSGVPKYFMSYDGSGKPVYMQLSVNLIPARPDSATSRDYVDNLPDKLKLTEEQKAKWRAWLGIE